MREMRESDLPELRTAMTLQSMLACYRAVEMARLITPLSESVVYSSLRDAAHDLERGIRHLTDPPEPTEH